MAERIGETQRRPQELANADSLNRFIAEYMALPHSDEQATEQQQKNEGYEKRARKIIRYYTFEALNEEISQELTEKVKQLFRLVRAKKDPNGQPYLASMQEAWIGQLNNDPRSSNRYAKNVDGLAVISLRMAFHIHGDEFGASNESLEGYDERSTLLYLGYFLWCYHTKYATVSSNPEDPVLYGMSQEQFDELARELKQAIEMASKPLRGSDQEKVDWKINIIRGKITEAFAQEQRLLLPGGWAGSPQGHAIFYELIPNKESAMAHQTATLRIYNLGAGANEHKKLGTGHKTRVLPYCDLKGVPRENFLKDVFIKILAELSGRRFFYDQTTKTDYGPNDIYEGFRGLLAPREVSSGAEYIEEEAYKSLQRAGICSWRSLLAFISTRMPKDDYKRFILDIKLQSLRDFANKFFAPKQTDQAPSDDNKASAWNFIDKAARKLSRTLAKSHKLVAPKYLARAIYQLSRIRQKLAATKAQVFSRPLPSIPTQGNPDAEQVVNLHELGHVWLPKPKERESMLMEQPCRFIFKQMRDQLKEQRCLVAKLDLLLEWRDRLGPNEAADQYAFNLALTEAITELPVVPTDPAVLVSPAVAELKALGLLNVEDRYPILVKLGELAKAFFRSSFFCPHIENRQPVTSFITLKILYLQVYLTENFVKEDLTGSTGHLSFKIDKLLEGTIYGDFYLRIDSSKLQEQLKIIYTFFQALRSIPQHCLSFEEDGSYYTEVEFADEYGRPKGQLNKHLLTMFPDIDALKDELRAKVTDFDKLPHSGQGAHLFASEHLPLWFKAIRDSYAYFNILLRHPLSTPSPPDMSDDLQILVKDESSSPSFDGPSFKVRFTSKQVAKDLASLQPEQRKAHLERASSKYEGMFHRIISDALRNSIRADFRDSAFYLQNERALLVYRLGQHGPHLPRQELIELAHIYLEPHTLISEALSYFISIQLRF